ncbi:MAG: HD domain-containing protein, partial [Oscillospiraceae bacterium]|nr:HD domain-containing protein [Oscillospiraceae bacterium]
SIIGKARLKGADVFLPDPRGARFLDRDLFEGVYASIQSLTVDQITQRFGVKRGEAAILMPSILLFNKFLGLTEAKGIITPLLSLRHGLLADMVDARMETGRTKVIGDDIINSVRFIGEKYMVDGPHSLTVERLSLSIFDQTSAIHGMSVRERDYLRIAALLHDIGKYINIVRHDIHSYNIIKFQGITGFSDKELDIVANIMRYHSSETPLMSHENYRVLDDADRVAISKLACILRVAEALDISHRQKVTDVKVRREEGDLVFTAKSEEDILLEKWGFDGHMEYFEEVMGYRPILKRKARGR